MTDANSRLQLRSLRPEDERAFFEAIVEARDEVPPWDFALGYEEPMTFLEYMQMVERWPRGEALRPGYVPGIFYVGVAEGTVVGRLSVRFRLNEKLARIGGHIGYGVRPAFRRRGYATAMLQQALPICAAQGIERALITCDVDNVASRKVIERCGGVFEGVTHDPELTIQKRRYWLQTA